MSDIDYQTYKTYSTLLSALRVALTVRPEKGVKPAIFGEMRNGELRFGVSEYHIMPDDGVLWVEIDPSAGKFKDIKLSDFQSCDAEIIAKHYFEKAVRKVFGSDKSWDFGRIPKCYCQRCYK